MKIAKRWLTPLITLIPLVNPSSVQAQLSLTVSPAVQFNNGSIVNQKEDQTPVFKSCQLPLVEGKRLLLQHCLGGLVISDDYANLLGLNTDRYESNGLSVNGSRFLPYGLFQYYSPPSLGGEAILQVQMGDSSWGYSITPPQINKPVNFPYSNAQGLVKGVRGNLIDVQVIKGHVCKNDSSSVVLQGNGAIGLVQQALNSEGRYYLGNRLCSKQQVIRGF